MQKQNRKPKRFTWAVLILITAAGVFFGIRKYSYMVTEESLKLPELKTAVLEYGSGIVDPAELIKETDQDVSVKDGQMIDTDTTGEQEITFIVKKTDVFSQTASKEFKQIFTVEDTLGPEIIISDNHIKTAVNSFPDLTAYVKCSDPADGELPYSDSLEKGTWTYEKTVLDTEGEHEIVISAMDSSGNISEDSMYVETAGNPAADSFYIRINRAANTVTIYEKNEDGTAGEPLKAMVCSTGDATPLGIYPTFAKYEWRALFGGVFGQYATAITGNILFHSVPYYSMNKGDLEYLEYNKLGTAASMGCVRLSVIDAKWIYENCILGTTVEFYDDEDNPGPLGKPVPTEIDTTSVNRGWDPTDPDPANPWNE